MDNLARRAYQLQRATNLFGSSWEAIVPDVTATSDSLTHTNSVGVGDQQFYRVLVLPQHDCSEHGRVMPVAAATELNSFLQFSFLPSKLWA